MKDVVSVVGYFERLGRSLQFGIALVGVLVLGILDYLTGYEAFFGVFYLFPIGFVAWYIGRGWGLAYSILSAAVWLLANTAAGETHSQQWIFGWNALTRFAVFSTVTVLLAALRAAHDHQRQLARTDYLTGAMNKRWFSDLATQELYRCRRHHRPFTLIYADLDNFKAVNDRFGHSTGDRLLREVVIAATQALRPLDVMARIGGDEFAVLLPETDQEGARQAAHRLRQSLLAAMQERGWPVSFSFGVVTCVAPPDTLDQLLHLADQRMYAVKTAGKNGIEHQVLTAGGLSQPAAGEVAG